MINNTLGSTIKKKFGALFWVENIFLLLMISIIGVILFNTLNGNIQFEDDSDSNPTVYIIMFFIVLTVYLISWLSLNITFIKNKGHAFIIDKDGIHNTYCVKIFLAFVLVMPIKYIPWKYIEKFEKASQDNNPDKQFIKIGVNQKDVLSGKIKTRNFGLFFLSLGTFNIPGIMVSKKFTRDEIKFIEKNIYLKSDYLKKELFDIDN